MKFSAWFSGFLLCAATLVYAQSPQQVFEQANQLYQQEKFVEARQAYESLVHNGYGGGELYYNLGNACYKSGDIAHAILYYERALKVMPNDDDLKHNLQLANLMITDKIESTPRLFVWDYWDSIKQMTSLQGITWLTYLFFVVTMGAVAIVIVARTYRTRRLAFISGATAAVIFVFFLTVLVARASDLARQDSAIVIASITTVKNSPDEKSSDAFVLHGGVKVHITDRLNEWVKIRLADGKVGWMESSAAAVI